MSYKSSFNAFVSGTNGVFKGNSQQQLYSILLMNLCEVIFESNLNNSQNLKHLIGLSF